MGTHINLISFIPLLLLSFTTISNASSQINVDDNNKLQTYIIQVRRPPHSLFSNPKRLESYYNSFLPKTNDVFAASRMVYQYKHAIIGFAAKLTEAEVQSMKKKVGFIDAYPERKIPLLTSHSPSFLGLEGANGLWKRDSTLGQGVIIGMIDTGVDPNHASFNDDGMKPPPSKWKGICLFNDNNMCNNKLIGGRAFEFGGDSAYVEDTLGHGTHTASTAAGNFVTNISMLGNGSGTASGMAPRAHIAVYKVCDDEGYCMTPTVIAGMDSAIDDGVDIINLSLGASLFGFSDTIVAEAGAFSAMEKGILVTCAAGNDGPGKASVMNDAAWVLTVGASTMDRRFRVTVKLGDGQELKGESMYQPSNFTTEMVPVVVPESPCMRSGESNCDVNLMNEKLVKGKIVVCHKSIKGSSIEIGETVNRLGGAGMILVNDESDGYTTLAEAHVLPASHVSYNDRKKISDYVRKEHNPTASFKFEGTVFDNSLAPSVASFSSRGPSNITMNILKPDIIGPGVSILGGWPIKTYDDRLTFNVMSGTSISTPHLSGVAALVKSKHPDWSPAAIKSALMTTSYIKSRDGKRITDEKHHPASYYMMGSGHVDPLRAIDPGLVYDLGKNDYVAFLCGLGHSDKQMEAFTHEKISCSRYKINDQSGLNYPSIAVSFQQSDKITVKRTVTYVGDGAQTFTLHTRTEVGFDVKVEPGTLEFSKAGEKKCFEVTLIRTAGGKDGVEGELNWISNKYVVRSPIVITKYM